MTKSPVAAWCVMEVATEPTKPQNLKVFDKNSLMYVRFDTTFQSFNVRNRNGRIYMGSAMVPSLNAEHILELEKKNSWLGEAGHPHSDDMKRILTIDPKLTSHRIVSHTVDNNFCRGTVETLDDGGYGTKMTKSILQGMEPAFSLRALAPITKRGDGTQLVQGKAHVVTYDWVILPSHKDAYRDESKPIETIVKQIGESGNSVSECSLTQVHESALKEFVAMESMNVKVVSNVCEVAMESMNISKDFRHAILKEGGTTYVVPLEEKIERDISRYMRNL